MINTNIVHYILDIIYLIMFAKLGTEDILTKMRWI